MKKVLLFLSVVMVAKTQAQINKGAEIYGGSIGIASAKNVGQFGNVIQNTSVNVSPSFGVAVSKNRIAGGFISLNFDKTEDKTNSVTVLKSSGNSYGGGYFERHYITLGKKFYYFTNISAGILFGKSNAEFGTNLKENRNTVSCNTGISPGVSYGLTNRFQLELLFNDIVSVHVSQAKTEKILNGTSQSKITTNNINLSSNLNPSASFNALQIGFRILINK